MKRIVVILALGLFMIALSTPVTAQFGMRRVPSEVETSDVNPEESNSTDTLTQTPGSNERTAPGVPPVGPRNERNSAPSFAQQDTPPNAQAQQNALEARPGSVNAEQRKQLIQSGDSQNRQEELYRWEKASLRLQQRLSWFDQRLSNILQRAQQRLAVLESNGTDVSQAAATLNEAEDLLNDARSNSDQAVTRMMQLDAASSNMSEEMPEVRSAVQDAHASYKEVRVKILEAVQEMKSAVGLITRNEETKSTLEEGTNE